MPHIIAIPPPSPSLGPNVRHGLVYFVSGNPGCIAWYDGFFRTLSTLLASLDGNFTFHIRGRDLAGFSDDHEPFSSKNAPFDVEAQIQLIGADIATQRINNTNSARDGQPYDFVILIGHSVGAYIALEIFHRHMKDRSVAPHLNLLHGILLFPTVTHIAQSPSGRRFVAIRKWPWLGEIIQSCILGFLHLQPRGFLWWVVRNVLGYSPEAADVTANFLKSRDAVRQALYMARDEMRVIAEDGWPEELWEVASGDVAGAPKVPKFFLFYGKNDHWVSNRLRDEFIQRRSEDEKAQIRILVDDGDLPHAFSTREESSLLVAGKVRDWIAEIVHGMSRTPS